MCRWLLVRRFAGMEDGMYYSIFVCNVLGSFGLGFLGMLLYFSPWFSSPGVWGEHVVRGFLLVGLFGGFTTFSTFSYDALMLLEGGRYKAALLYMFGSVMLSLLMVWLGVTWGRILSRVLWE
jgi:CrcB protein